MRDCRFLGLFLVVCLFLCLRNVLVAVNDVSAAIATDDVEENADRPVTREAAAFENALETSGSDITGATEALFQDKDAILNPGSLAKSENVVSSTKTFDNGSLMSTPNLLLSKEGLLQQLEKQADLLKTKLKQEYGEYYAKVFELEGTSIGNHVFYKSPSQLGKGLTAPKQEGWNRMVRKFQIKLLQVQLASLQGEKNQFTFIG